MASNNLTAIPCIVYRNTKTNPSVYIPDFDVTVGGQSLTEVIARACMLVEALKVYHDDRNIPFVITTSYEELALKHAKDKTPHFVHMLTIKSEG